MLSEGKVMCRGFSLVSFVFLSFMMMFCYGLHSGNVCPLDFVRCRFIVINWFDVMCSINLLNTNIYTVIKCCVLGDAVLTYV